MGHTQAFIFITPVRPLHSESLDIPRLCLHSVSYFNSSSVLHLALSFWIISSVYRLLFYSLPTLTSQKFSTCTCWCYVRNPSASCQKWRLSKFSSCSLSAQPFLSCFIQMTYTPQQNRPAFVCKSQRQLTSIHLKWKGSFSVFILFIFLCLFLFSLCEAYVFSE